jgi:AraC-like DNA-binding protein
MITSLLSLADKLISVKNESLNDLGITNSNSKKSIESIVSDSLLQGAVKLSEVAKELGMSSRSLQRKLESKGTTLSQVVVKVRKSMVFDLMKNKELSNEDVALKLGYSTLSAFNKAFRQWYKLTPTEYKKLNGI